MSNDDERLHLEEGARILRAVHELGLVRNAAYGAALDRWLEAEITRSGIRPIVVGSVWRHPRALPADRIVREISVLGHARLIHLSGGAQMFEDVFREEYSWVNDPPP